MTAFYPSKRKFTSSVTKLVFSAFAAGIVHRAEVPGAYYWIAMAGIVAYAAFELLIAISEFEFLLKKVPLLKFSNDGITYTYKRSSTHIPWESIKKVEDITQKRTGQHMLYYNYRDRFLRISFKNRGVDQKGSLPIPNEITINSDYFNESIPNIIAQLNDTKNKTRQLNRK